MTLIPLKTVAVADVASWLAALPITPPQACKLRESRPLPPVSSLRLADRAIAENRLQDAAMRLSAHRAGNLEEEAWRLFLLGRTTPAASTSQASTSFALAAALALTAAHTLEADAGALAKVAGAMADSRGEEKSAETSNEPAESVREHCTRLAAMAFEALGRIRCLEDRPGEALRFDRIALSLRLAAGAFVECCDSLTAVALDLKLQSQWESAEGCFERALLWLSQAPCDVHASVARVHECLARLSLERKDYIKARDRALLAAAAHRKNQPGSLAVFRAQLLSAEAALLAAERQLTSREAAESGVNVSEVRAGLERLQSEFEAFAPPPRPEITRCREQISFAAMLESAIRS